MKKKKTRKKKIWVLPSLCIILSDPSAVTRLSFYTHSQLKHCPAQEKPWSGLTSFTDKTWSRLYCGVGPPLSLNPYGPKDGSHLKPLTLILPALLQKLVGEFFFYFSLGNLENLVGNLEGILRGFFLTHRTKAQKFRGKFRSIFRKKIRGSKKIFRAKFTLQTCHLKH